MSNDELTTDEAELVSLARAGINDASARAAARAALEAMWSADHGRVGTAVRTVGLMAVGAGLTVKAPDALGILTTESAYSLNVGLLVLPWVIALFGIQHSWSPRTWATAGAALVAALTAVNVFPFVDSPASSTLTLTAIHIPVVLWFLVGTARAGGSWREPRAQIGRAHV